MKKTKKQKIKEHLELGNGITQKDAIELFNAYRLSAVIFDLKRDGMKIETIDKSHVNADGQNIRFAEYKMIGAPGDKDQISMFTDSPKVFRSWLDQPPKLKKGDIR
tara:strand:+ start:877 stop:1194 length:318 start_codon:yes stop_codon:yes gene_type:complete